MLVCYRLFLSECIFSSLNLNFTYTHNCTLHNWSCNSGQRERSLKPVLILDFWGPYTERWRVWLGWKNRCNAFMCFTLSWVALAESTHFFRGSVRFQQFFWCFFFQARNSITFTLHDLTDFLRWEGDSAPHYNKLSFMFSYLLAKLKNETKIKTSLGARGPPGVSGALRSLRIVHIGRIALPEAKPL